MFVESHDFLVIRSTSHQAIAHKLPQCLATKTKAHFRNTKK